MEKQFLGLSRRVTIPCPNLILLEYIRWVQINQQLHTGGAGIFVVLNEPLSLLKKKGGGIFKIVRGKDEDHAGEDGTTPSPDLHLFFFFLSQQITSFLLFSTLGAALENQPCRVGQLSTCFCRAVIHSTVFLMAVISREARPDRKKTKNQQLSSCSSGLLGLLACFLFQSLQEGAEAESFEKLGTISFHLENFARSAAAQA